jgi:hypothetical protein
MTTPTPVSESRGKLRKWLGLTDSDVAASAAVPFHDEDHPLAAPTVKPLPEPASSANGTLTRQEVLTLTMQTLKVPYVDNHRAFIAKMRDRLSSKGASSVTRLRVSRLPNNASDPAPGDDETMVYSGETVRRRMDQASVKDVWIVQAVDNWDLSQSYLVAHGVGMVKVDAAVLAEGEFAEGRLHGYARVVGGDDGNEYMGGFVRGKREGEGIEIWSDGSVYCGGWRADREHGFGELVTLNGFHYKGSWAGGMRDGVGRLTFPSGAVYSGEFSADERHGYGVMLYSSGEIYHGRWEKGVRSGDGELLYPNGCRYQGKFEGDMKSGFGTLFLPFRKVWYEGMWYRDTRHGKGKCYHKNGDVYEGNFSKDKKSGVGTCVFADGACYTGEWYTDFQHGFGTKTYSNGDTYTGAYALDHRHGPGKYTWKAGCRLKGVWNAGKVDCTKDADPEAAYNHALQRKAMPMSEQLSGTSMAPATLHGLLSGSQTIKVLHSESTPHALSWDTSDMIERHFQIPGLLHAGSFKSWSGKIFQGEFVEIEGLEVGPGEVYSGLALMDKPWGYGVLKRQDGFSYTGEFVLGKPSGFGEGMFPNGHRYTGVWALGKPHGFGRLAFPAGGTLVAKFSKGVITGTVRLLLPHLPTSILEAAPVAVVSSASLGASGRAGGSSAKIVASSASSSSAFPADKHTEAPDLESADPDLIAKRESLVASERERQERRKELDQELASSVALAKQAGPGEEVSPVPTPSPAPATLYNFPAGVSEGPRPSRFRRPSKRPSLDPPEPGASTGGGGGGGGASGVGGGSSSISSNSGSTAALAAAELEQALSPANPQAAAPPPPAQVIDELRCVLEADSTPEGSILVNWSQPVRFQPGHGNWVFEGLMREGLMPFKGTYVFPDGVHVKASRWTGDRMTNSAHAQILYGGKAKSAAVYCGSIVWAGSSFAPHGRGKWTHGSKALAGTWVRGELDGFGVLIDLEQGQRYEGPVSKGRPHGANGTIRYDTGFSLTGTFKNGVAHGECTLTYPKGAATFTGSYRHGNRHGLGRFVILSGPLQGRASLREYDDDKLVCEIVEPKQE